MRRQTVGWGYVHVCIDDATRLAYVEVLSDEKAITAVAFLRRAVNHFASYAITVERLITDNGSAYRSAIPRDRLPHARDRSPAHPPLPTPDQPRRSGASCVAGPGAAGVLPTREDRMRAVGLCHPYG